MTEGRYEAAAKCWDATVKIFISSETFQAQETTLGMGQMECAADSVCFYSGRFAVELREGGGEGTTGRGGSEDKDGAAQVQHIQLRGYEVDGGLEDRHRRQNI